MARTLTVAHNRPGPAWVERRTSREQPYWDEHAAFIDGLVEQGVLLLGGPYEDYSGALLVFDGPDADDVRALLATDPFVVHGVFAQPDVRAWLIWVDSSSSVDREVTPDV